MKRTGLNARPILTIREQLGKLQATRQSDDGIGGGEETAVFRHSYGHRRGTAKTLIGSNGLFRAREDGHD